MKSISPKFIFYKNRHCWGPKKYKQVHRPQCQSFGPINPQVWVDLAKCGLIWETPKRSPEQTPSDPKANPSGPQRTPERIPAFSRADPRSKNWDFNLNSGGPTSVLCVVDVIPVICEGTLERKHLLCTGKVSWNGQKQNQKQRMAGWLADPSRPQRTPADPGGP